MTCSPKQRWSHPAVILVATDLNDLDRLMPFALDQASQCGARLVLLHVLASTASLSTDAAGRPYYDTQGLLDAADKALVPWCETARQREIICDALVREGNAAQQIATAARQFQADRVLLGTRSRSKISKLLLGSVAEQVLRSIHLPVMTVGPEAHLRVNECDERIVLHATALRETSRPSAALACQIAEAERARLMLLHVLAPLDWRQEHELSASAEAGATRERRLQAVREELRKLAAETRSACCQATETVAVEGNPVIEILAEACDRRATLLVLGSTRRSTLANLTRDRVIDRVLAHAPCPVLTLREPLETDDMAHHVSMEAAQL